ncbi:MAG: peptidoglycan recognition protein family protein [Fimbriimonadaceae bacterium]|nr:peptidoglycan recognition protein family protein [Fimbriimonadaceae bacterium]
MPIPFVGRRMSRTEFEQHLAGLTFAGFQPRSVTLHHTASPSLAQRPQGFTAQHLLNLRHYYENTMGWSGAPHVFVDDQADGIIVFQRLDRRGVHAVSFNATSWGVEMLGFFDTESPTTGRGLKVYENAMAALALMNKRIGVGAETVKFHRDDPRTRKTCPGTRIDKVKVIRDVAARMQAAPPPDLDDQETFNSWRVFLHGGTEFLPVRMVGGRPVGPIRAMLDALTPGGSLRLSTDKQKVFWTPPGPQVAREIPVAEIDERGASWALIRDLATAAGRTLAVNGREIRISS